MPGRGENFSQNQVFKYSNYTIEKIFILIVKKKKKLAIKNRRRPFKKKKKKSPLKPFLMQLSDLEKKFLIDAI